MDLTPKQIVKYLDDYIIGQDDAKKTIALALRNRFRRMQVEPVLQEEIMPKNILMIGSTGVGKTEIARRLAKMMGLPFVKVEASKYTEVGFVGRDVESMIRDLVYESINLVTKEYEEKIVDKIDGEVNRKIIEKLVPPLPETATETAKESFIKTYNKMEEKLLSGALDDKKIEIELPKKTHVEIIDSSMPMDMSSMQESLSKMLGGLNKEKVKKEVTIKDARVLLRDEASENLLDHEAIKIEAIKRTENGGIIFLDEIDKIATGTKSQNQDPSKEGVQRDLLPIVEGSSVQTKFGQVKTDHILFIAAGAFHVSKPSDLLPELQGRFPLRVELSSLDEDALYKILTNTKNSLLRQYEALLKVEDVTLEFSDDAIHAFAKYSVTANEKTEDIGARRLHTVIEKVIEDISFSADEKKGETIIVDKDLVEKKLEDIVENEDTARYIL
ncbi:MULTISPECIES: ATP-dependent protease ATPase subunit HslU [Malaciobacter]|jgi:ATP-dependent HslUV protease ATP-binding subunit HslU|uniref:ATP-dependent HslUV protease ATP-binding subunit HslU n=2 Tax=Malaciobacter TaxID=2321114 RepID=A0A1T5D646_9BACT|nr:MULTISPECIES: ATP-dependent protease ATPase subunit HslU [Malaciobacter]AXX87385.1 heat shock protein HslVU, ATPase subunit [Malaciobacter marinus]PHO11072.1 ATP-dependent protease ATPase subunit HslU [Malaciobacter canalis]PHO13647.1 ATP-dependent protease ATPase subunit HslU [Malaciobacter marinus]PHO16270.1 ATP-dependent protease ATPase subunit HslU [Malaciobacter marinus]PPK62987.1 ATP-dependent HslUV protease ATP-binding subunit HslU [Malaciobacter marinus]